MEKTPSSGEEKGVKKGPWTAEEDQKLIDYIQRHGHGRWRTLPKNAGLKRCGKSCRLRWTNYLRPDIKRGKFSFEEEDIIIRMHSILGNKWSMIAAHLAGRTDNEIKNYWNTHIRKRLLSMGIDPVTHTPRQDLLHLSSLLQSAAIYQYHPYPLFNPNPNLLGLTTQPLVNNWSQATPSAVPDYTSNSLYNTDTQQHYCEPHFQNRFQEHHEVENAKHRHTTSDRLFPGENRATCENFVGVACNCHYCSLPKLSQYKDDDHGSSEELYIYKHVKVQNFGL